MEAQPWWSAPGWWQVIPAWLTLCSVIYGLYRQRKETIRQREADYPVIEVFPDYAHGRPAIRIMIRNLSSGSIQLLDITTKKPKGALLGYWIANMDGLGDAPEPSDMVKTLQPRRAVISPDGPYSTSLSVWLPQQQPAEWELALEFRMVLKSRTDRFITLATKTKMPASISSPQD